MGAAESPSEELLATLIAEIQDRINRGVDPDVDAYVERFPQFEAELREVAAVEGFLEDALLPTCVPARPLLDDEASRLDLKEFPIHRRLDDIGLGTVYLLGGVDGSMRELIVLRAWFTPRQRDNVERAARFAASRPVAGIVRILEVGRLNRVPFIVREHVSSATLTTLVRLLRDADGAENVADAFRRWRRELDITVAADVVEAAGAAARLAQDRRHLALVAGLVREWAEALERAHVRGTFHGEVTADNLLVSHDGDAVVHGMGTAWHGTGIALDRMRDFNAAWCAPEVVAAGDVAAANGLTERPVSWLADVYGLALSLWSILALRFPASDGGAADADELLDLLPRRTPSRLKRVLRSALSADLYERQTSAAALADEVEAAVGGSRSLKEALLR